MRKAKNLLVIAFLVFVLGESVMTMCRAEDITITTYYPSPYGSYNQLQANSLGVGDNNNSGSLDSGDVPATAGDVWIKGQITIAGGSPGDKKVLTSDATGLANWQAPASTPSGAVMFFNLTACPSGWSAYVAANGRYVVGKSTNTNIASTQGTALSDLEARSTVGIHNHGFSTSNAGAHTHGINDPGHSHRMDIGNEPPPSSMLIPSVSRWTNSPPSVIGYSALTSITIISAGDHNHSGTTANAGTSDIPAPYIQLLVCQKD